MTNPKPKIAGVGELLWDMLPDGARLGGAPANFACHCYQLGAEAYPVSRVGDDDLGLEAQAGLEKLGVSAKFVQESATHLTGRVLVSLDAAGKPSYEIIADVAWDHLEFTSELKTLATSLDAACFGVLAQRSFMSRETIRTFLRHMPEQAYKILDVNLREPFFSKELVDESLQLATILKLSDEELPILASYFSIVGSPIEQLIALRSRFDLDLVAYTCGRDGSILISPKEIDENPGCEATAVDSVGAGDSFTAALCVGLLRGESLASVNTFANRVAAFVCSQEGATPKLPATLTEW